MRPLSSFFSPPRKPASIGPCFRTDPEGRIALTRDWRSLLAGTRPFERLVLQTRHRCAHLLSLGPIPALSWQSDNNVASDESGGLHLHLAHWRQAWGRLAHCPCCGSPGRIEVLDTNGAECLQLCAHSEDSPAGWAAYLATIAAPLNAAPAAPQAGGPSNHFPRLPADAVPLTHDALLLPALLALLENGQTPFACTLRTMAITHARELTPRRLSCEDGLLTVGDGTTTLQAALGSAEGLAVQPQNRRLHLAGPAGTSLLTLQPAADPAAAHLWNTALRRVFSCLD